MSAFDDLIPKASQAQSGIRVISQSAPDPSKPLEIVGKQKDNVLTDAKTVAANFDNANAPDTLKFDRAEKLRRDYERLPSVVAYRTSIPMYATAINTQSTPEGDMTLIKAFAKLTDPTTGVLNGEGQAVAESGPYVERTVQSLQNQLDASGTLSERARSSLRQELTRLMKNRNMTYNQARSDFSKFSSEGGVDQFSVVGSHAGEPYRGVAQEYEDRRQRTDGNPDVVAGSNATTTTVAPPPEMQARLRDYIAKNKGNLDVQDFAAAFNFMAKEAGYDGRVDPNSEQTREELKALNRGASFGGVSPATRPLTDAEQGVNKFLLSPVGGAAVGAVNALTMNGFDNALELAGADGNLIRRDMDATRDANPLSNAAGGLAASLALPFSAGAGLGRVALEAAGYGAASAFGDADDGSFIDRVAAGAIGGVVGAGGGYAAGKLIGTGRAAFDGPIGPIAPPQSAIRYRNALDAGITNPSLGETRGGSLALIEKGLESIPGASGRMSSAAQTRLDETANAVDIVAGKYGDGGSFLSRGDALIDGARNWIGKAKGDKSIPYDRGVVGKAYDRIPISPRADASLDETRGFLKSAVGRFDDNPELAAMANDPQLKQYLSALTLNAKGDGGKLSWDSLKQFRTLVGRKMEDAVIQGNGDARDGLRGIYGALSRDMESTAAAAGPKALNYLKFADDLFERVQTRIEGALTKILGKTDGNTSENAGALIDKITKGNSVTADIRSFIEIRKSMPKEAWGTVASSVYRLLGQPLKSEGRDFSPQTFLKNWGDMNTTAKNLFFPKGPLRVEMDKLNDVIKGMGDLQAMGNVSGTARVASVMGMILGGTTAAAGQVLTGGALTRLWQDPRFVQFATGYTRMVKGGGGVRGAKLYSKKLDNLAKASPTLAQDIFQLRDNIMNMSEDSDEQDQ